MKRFLISNLIVLVLVACSEKPGGKSPIVENSPGAESRSVAKGNLVNAVYDGDLVAVKQLVKDGADINENVGTDTNEITPLLVAIAYGRQDIAAFLLERKAALHGAYKGYRAKEFATQVFPEGSQVQLLLRQRLHENVRPTTQREGVSK